MSNWKHAYGWYGHIITTEESSEEHNVIAVDEDAFKRLLDDIANIRLDTRIGAKPLGVPDEYGDEHPIATGIGFSTGFEFYGTVFTEVEMRERGKMRYDAEVEYIAAMKEIYGIDLPPCRPMVGCSSEN